MQVAEAVARQFPMHIEASSDRLDPDQRNYEVAFDRITRARLQGDACRWLTSIAQVGSVARVVDDAQRWRFVA